MLPRMRVPAVGTEGVGLAAEGSVVSGVAEEGCALQGRWQAECPLDVAGTREN